MPVHSAGYRHDWQIYDDECIHSQNSPHAEPYYRQIQTPLQHEKKQSEDSLKMYDTDLTYSACGSSPSDYSGKFEDSFCTESSKNSATLTDSSESYNYVQRQFSSAFNDFVTNCEFRACDSQEEQLSSNNGDTLIQSENLHEQHRNEKKSGWFKTFMRQFDRRN